MLGDTGVAVHPDDERYKSLVGKQVKLPLVGRLIPIIADEYADPTKGSGAVKITPAHDFNDYQVGKRNNLAALNILTDDGAYRMTSAPQGVSGAGAVRGAQEDGRRHGGARACWRRSRTRPSSSRSATAPASSSSPI